jgi:hypothetical protein
VQKFLYPTSATLWHDQSIPIVGDNIGKEHNANQRYHYFSYHSPLPADGDTFEQHFYLKGGTYDLYVLGARNPDQAKLDVFIDDILVANYNFYAGTTIFNWETINTVSVLGHGQHVLRGVINGRVPPSTNWRTRITKFWFVEV